jgi:hypothetical protein
MSAATKSGVLIIGGPPRAELLPPEVAQGVKARALRRTLVFLVVVVAAITALGVVGATALSIASVGALATATDQGNALLVQQGEFAEVRQITSMIGKAEEGLELGSATEIQWKAYFAEIEGSLPAGTTITTFAAATATPTTPFAAPTLPLQGARIGELTFTATSATLPDVELWLNGLSTITGFVDATPGTVVLATGGGYTVNIIMHINSDVFDNPYSRAAPDAGTTPSEGN